MHEPSNGAPLSLESLALRFAARDLPPPEAEAFEARLAGDQSARDALAEAVRLSAAALGQEPPRPDRSFRAVIRARLRGARWLTRRAYRGHPLVWAGVGGGLVAAATLLALSLAGTASPESAQPSALAAAPAAPVLPPIEPAGDQSKMASACDGCPVVVHAAADSPDDSTRTAAEIWAELSTPGHVEKTRDDEIRLHNLLKHLHAGHPNHPMRTEIGLDSPH
jgi:hypothetical protein